MNTRLQRPVSSPMRIPLTRSAVLLLAALTTAPTLGATRTFDYELRAGGLRLGKARLELDGKGRVRLRTKIRTLGGRLTEITTASASWVGTDGLPRRTRWRWRWFGRSRRVDAIFGRTGMDGRYFDGERLVRRTKQHSAGRLHDVLSVFRWLVTGDLAPGSVHRASVYAGNRIVTLDARVAAAQSLDLGDGPRRVHPVDITTTGGKTVRHLRLWVDPSTRTPCRLELALGRLGSVQAVLVAER